jgi:hypothetical protein
MLQAGATFTGNFVLPPKTGASYITIRSSADDSVLPGPDTRIDPSYSPQLPKLQSPNSSPALATLQSAHHYRLLCLEFLPTFQGFYDIVALGDGSSDQNSLSLVPHDLIVDRVYVHGDVTFGQKRGIAINSASTEVLNSYISEIKAEGQDSQALGGTNGPGPYLIKNNYLEAAGENVMFGGGDPSIPNLVPSDITFTGNYLTKQLAWRDSKWSVKNIFELKNTQRIHIEGNVMEYCWPAGQTGYAVLFTVRNQDGSAPWSTVEDVLEFRNNVVRHVASVFSIHGTDDAHTSQPTNNITVRNNLFDDVNTANWGGEGRLMTIGGGMNITFDHNTIVNNGMSTVYAYGAPVTGFTFTNNIIPDNGWAIIGDGIGIGNVAIDFYFPNSRMLNGIYIAAPPSNYPAGNFFPPTVADVGFIDFANGNYRLAPTSPYKGAGTDGKDVGADIDAINAAAGTHY